MSGEREVALSDRFCRAEHVVGRKIAGEYILVPIVHNAADLDSIFDLNRVGAFIWERLDGIKSGAEIVYSLVKTFDVDESRAALDYRIFLTQLESIGVVARREAVAPIGSNSVATGSVEAATQTGRRGSSCR